MAEYPNCEAMITDVCVPLSKLADLIAQTKEDINQSFLAAPLVAHAGDGRCHGPRRRRTVPSCLLATALPMLSMPVLLPACRYVLTPNHVPSWWLHRQFSRFHHVGTKWRYQPGRTVVIDILSKPNWVLGVPQVQSHQVGGGQRGEAVESCHGPPSPSLGRDVHGRAWHWGRQGE